MRVSGNYHRSRSNPQQQQSGSTSTSRTYFQFLSSGNMSSSSSISNLSSSAGRSWSTVFADCCKVAFALSICTYSIYSAYVKFSPLFFSNNTQNVTLRFKADYSLCNPLIAQGFDQSQCSSQIDKIFIDAKSQCHGYIKNFESCLGQYRDCSVQESNTRSCLSMVMRNELNQWAKAQNPQTISVGGDT